MREFDEYGLKICRFQGELFSASLKMTECSSPVFLRRFLLSDVAKRMDNDGFRFESVNLIDVIDEVNEQYGESSYGKVRYGVDELYWIGYLYRYWAYTQEIGSKALYRMVKPATLRDLYLPYHSLDPKQAIERITEANELPSEDEMLQRGVEILKKIRARKAEKNPTSLSVKYSFGGEERQMIRQASFACETVELPSCGEGETRGDN